MKKIAIVILMAGCSLGLWAESTPACSPPVGTSFEVAIDIGELNGVPDVQRHRILPAVVAQLQSHLPFLQIVQGAEESRFRLRLSIGPFLRVKRIDSWPKEEWYKLERSEPSAVVEGVEITCARGEEGSPVPDACETLFILKFRTVDPTDTDGIIEYFVETLVKGLCEHLAGAPN